MQWCLQTDVIEVTLPFQAFSVIITCVCEGEWFCSCYITEYYIFILKAKEKRWHVVDGILSEKVSSNDLGVEISIDNVAEAA